MALDWLIFLPSFINKILSLLHNLVFSISHLFAVVLLIVPIHSVDIEVCVLLAVLGFRFCGFCGNNHNLLSMRNPILLCSI